MWFLCVASPAQLRKISHLIGGDTQCPGDGSVGWASAMQARNREPWKGLMILLNIFFFLPYSFIYTSKHRGKAELCTARHLFLETDY